MFARIAVLGLWLGMGAMADEAPLSLAAAMAEKQVRAEWMGNGRDTATLKLMNPGATPLKLTLPAGSVLAAENGEKQITLRALTTELAPNGEADAILPTAALSSKNTS